MFFRLFSFGENFFFFKKSMDNQPMGLDSMRAQKSNRKVALRIRFRCSRKVMFYSPYLQSARYVVNMEY